MKRKILGALLSLCLMATTLSAFSITASAAGYYIYYNGNGATSGVPGATSSTTTVDSINISFSSYPIVDMPMTAAYNGTGGVGYGWYVADAGQSLYTTERNPSTSSTLYTSTGATATSYKITGIATSHETATVTYAQPSRTGYTFAGWYTAASGGSYVGAGTTYTNQSPTLYAHWNANNYSLSVNSSNTSYGTVSGSGTYAYGTSQTITATPNTGYKFTGWSDGNTVNPRNVTISGNATYTANFAPISYTISTAVNNSKYGSVTGGGAGNYNTTKTLTATPSTGYKFTGWTDGNTQNPRTVTIKGNATYTANFAAESRTITVSANPSDGGGVSGSGIFDYGTTVNLSATANTGYKFTGWYNGETKVSDNSAYSFTATETISLEARFERNTFTVTLETGKGTITSGNVTEYTYGTGALLPTAENLSYASLTFAGWYEDIEFSGSPVTVISATDTGNKTYYAKWTASGVTAGSFVSFVDSGFYSLAPDAADEEKDGIIAFSTEFENIAQYGSQVTDFGIWIYKAGATESEKVQLCKTDADSLAELKTNGGKFYATVEEIASTYFDNEAIAMPYIVIGGQVYFGNPITGKVNLTKWLGEKTAAPTE